MPIQMLVSIFLRRESLEKTHVLDPAEEFDRLLTQLCVARQIKFHHGAVLGDATLSLDAFGIGACGTITKVTFYMMNFS